MRDAKDRGLPDAAAQFRIIDAHVNIGSGELEGDPIKSAITPEDILALMAESGIEKSVIFPASRPSGYSEANGEVAEYVKEHPTQFIGFGRLRTKPVAQPTRRAPRGLPKVGKRLAQSGGAQIERLANRYPLLRKKASPESDGRCRAELRRCFEEYRLHGIKMHPVEDGYPGRAALEVLHEFHKPLLLHCGRGVSLRRIEDELVRPYSIPIILAHMGGFPADRALYFRAIDLAATYPNVFLNTSFVFYSYILEEALSRCPAKVIFGSDSPGIHPRTATTAILTLRASDELKQMIFRENLAQLLEI